MLLLTRLSLMPFGPGAGLLGGGNWLLGQGFSTLTQSFSLPFFCLLPLRCVWLRFATFLCVLGDAGCVLSF